MFYQLPPAGDRIRLAAGAHAGRSPKEIFLPWQAEYFSSGTAALAAAILAAIRFRGVPEPEVILPAYGCPDLVSAVLHAGARPVLVDLEPDRPWLDLGQLEASIGPHTAAIVAASLFGIPERMAELRALAGHAQVLLIEDSAQAFPAAGTGSFWRGDLVVVSFGRGKPVSLLGGGAVLVRDEALRARLPACRPVPARARQRLAFRLQAGFYNLMSSPRAYWLPAGLPFLHLGETRFHPLPAVHGMDAARLELLDANLDAFRHRSRHVQSALAARLAELANHSEQLIDLPSACHLPAGHVLLRYPLLLAPRARDAAYNLMRNKGLGASTMYRTALPGIAGLARRLAAGGALPAAHDFGRRLLTLPVHERVSDADIRAIAACLEELVC